MASCPTNCKRKNAYFFLLFSKKTKIYQKVASFFLLVPVGPILSIFFKYLDGRELKSCMWAKIRCILLLPSPALLHSRGLGREVQQHRTNPFPLFSQSHDSAPFPLFLPLSTPPPPPSSTASGTVAQASPSLHITQSLKAPKPDKVETHINVMSRNAWNFFIRTPSARPPNFTHKLFVVFLTTVCDSTLLPPPSITPSQGQVNSKALASPSSSFS